MPWYYDQEQGKVVVVSDKSDIPDKFSRDFSDKVDTTADPSNGIKKRPEERRVDFSSRGGTLSLNKG